MKSEYKPDVTVESKAVPRPMRDEYADRLPPATAPSPSSSSSPKTRELQSRYVTSADTRDSERIRAQADSILLNGKTISEWKVDCECFYAEKLAAEKLNVISEARFAHEIMNLAESAIRTQNELQQLTEVNRKLTEDNVNLTALNRRLKNLLDSKAD